MQIEKTNLSLANRQELLGVFSQLGLIVEETQIPEHSHIFKSREDLDEGNVAECGGCGTEITLENFGHLAKGSKVFYCKNPLCFTHYIANKKLR